MWAPTHCLLLLAWLFKERPIGQIGLAGITQLQPEKQWCSCSVPQEQLEMPVWTENAVCTKAASSTGLAGSYCCYQMLPRRWEGGRERGTAACLVSVLLLWGTGLGKRRSLNWWGVEPAFDSVEIKGYVSTLPRILLRSLEPLMDSAGCPGTTNCRIEPSWWYLKLSL